MRDDMTPEIKRLRALLEESRSTACGQALAPLLGTIPALLDVAELAERHRRELVDYGCAEDDDPEYDCISFEAAPMCRRCEALLTWAPALAKLGVG